MLATLSREIRANLNGIMGSADLLIEDAASRLQREHLTTLRSSAEALHMSLNESFGILFTEALGTGTPVVAHDGPVSRWILEDRAHLVDTTREPDVVRETWLEARRAWHREVANFLTYRAEAGIDSPMMFFFISFTWTSEVSTSRRLAWFCSWIRDTSSWSACWTLRSWSEMRRLAACASRIRFERPAPSAGLRRSRARGGDVGGSVTMKNAKYSTA